MLSYQINILLILQNVSMWTLDTNLHNNFISCFFASSKLPIIPLVPFYGLASTVLSQKEIKQKDTIISGTRLDRFKSRKGCFVNSFEG